MDMVMELLPGDEVRSGTFTATFIARTGHPLYPGLYLVTWWLPRERRWSHDALHPQQVVGDVAPSTDEDRVRRLRAALLGTDGADRG